MPVPKRSGSVAGSSGGRRSVAASRSKSTASRRRGEEVLEVPDTSLVADGQRTYFIGGFSKHASIGSLYDISQEKENSGNEVVVLPGTYSPGDENNQQQQQADESNNNSRPTSSNSSVAFKKGEVAVRSLDIRAFHPPSAAPQSKVVVNFANDVDDNGDNGGNEDDDGNNGDDGDMNNGGGGNNGGMGGAEQILPPSQPPIIRDVIFTGDATFVRFVPPHESGSPLAALAPEQSLAPTTTGTEKEREPRSVRAMSMRSTASKKSIASTEESSAIAAAARESATPSLLPTGGLAQQDDGANERGVRPSTWPTITFNGISFERGMITLKTAHAVFEKCHFSVPNASYFVQVMPYCKATFVDCTFSAPSKACIYGFPHANIICRQCHFSGLDLLAIQDDRDSMDQLAADRLDQSARGIMNNVGLLVDDAIVNLDNCHFLHLSHGIVLQNRCSDSRIKKCVFECIDGSAAFFGKASQPFFTKNYIAASCTGRGVYFGVGSRPKASENQVASRVVISNGSAPVLKNNHFSVRIEEQNDTSAPYMEPRY